MRIAVDARELAGRATGVGRYLQRLLQQWALDRVPHAFSLYTPTAQIAAPPGLEAPDTRNALKVPPLNTPERPRGKDEPCLDTPPPFNTGTGTADRQSR